MPDSRREHPSCCRPGLHRGSGPAGSALSCTTQQLAGPMQGAGAGASPSPWLWLARGWVCATSASLLLATGTAARSLQTVPRSSAPPRARTPARPGRRGELTDQALTDIVTRALGNYLPGAAGNLRADRIPGAHLTTRRCRCGRSTTPATPATGAATTSTSPGSTPPPRPTRPLPGPRSSLRRRPPEAAADNKREALAESRRVTRPGPHSTMPQARSGPSARSGTARAQLGHSSGRARARQTRARRKNPCTSWDSAGGVLADTSRFTVFRARSRTGTTGRPAYGVPLAALAVPPGEKVPRDPGRPLTGPASRRFAPPDGWRRPGGLAAAHRSPGTTSTRRHRTALARPGSLHTRAANAP